MSQHVIATFFQKNSLDVRRAWKHSRDYN